MKSVACIFLFFSCFQVIAQDNYLLYYQNINEAKLLAADGRYEASIAQFSSAFDTFEFEFARDVINAAEISTLVKNDSISADFIKIALKRGVNIDFFKQNDRFESFRKSANWSDLERKAEAYHQAFLASVNTSIRTEINAMFEKDQAWRAKYYKAINFPIRPFIMKKWEAENALQVERIIEITKQYGFPGEKMIGVDLMSYHIKIEEQYYSCGMPIVIFIHHYSQPNISFNSLLKEQIFNGNLYNEHFATICDFEAAYGKGKFENLGFFEWKLNPKNMIIKDLNEKRNKIGLMTVKEINQLNQSNIITKFWKRLY